MAYIRSLILVLALTFVGTTAHGGKISDVEERVLGEIRDAIGVSISEAQGIWDEIQVAERMGKDAWMQLTQRYPKLEGFLQRCAQKIDGRLAEHRR